MATALVLRHFQKLDFYLASASLIAMTAVAIAGIFYRFVLNDPLIWSDEVAKLIFTWFCFTGMSVIARHGTHLRIDLISHFLPQRTQLSLRLFGNVFVFGTALLLLGYGLVLCVSQAGNSFSSIPISRAWSFAALPAGAVLMATQLLPLVSEDVRSLRSGEAR